MNYIQHTKLEDDHPSIGDLAINEDGALGVITHYITPLKTCVGVHVSNDHAPKGSEWIGHNPQIIGCVDDAKAFAESLKDE